jgi:hypothetical protein|tara:strand:- start:59 stop:1390 length:1332 start_codon:yes stop_codon:yes gene_type:complete
VAEIYYNGVVSVLDWTVWDKPAKLKRVFPGVRMAAKETKSPQEILHEMKTAERARVDGKSATELGTEIEMEGAMIRGGMPTFEYLHKRGKTQAPGYGAGWNTNEGTVTGEVFQLSNGKRVVLVPEDQITQFMTGRGIQGFDNMYSPNSVDSRRVMKPEVAKKYRDGILAALKGNKPTDYRPIHEPSVIAYDPKINVKMKHYIARYRFLTAKEKSATNESQKQLYARLKKSLETQYRADKDKIYGADFQRKVAAYEQDPDEFIRESESVGVPQIPTYNLGGGFHLILGAEQEYQDKDSFGTYEMTDDGPVLRDRGESVSSLPIVVYSNPETGSLSRSSSSLGSRLSPVGLGDLYGEYYDVNRSEIKPELIPGFTGRDVIDGYKTAKAGQRAKPSAPIEPAPAPEPRPEAPSSFRSFELPVVETLKGRRRMAKRRFDEQQELSDE